MLKKIEAEGTKSISTNSSNQLLKSAATTPVVGFLDITQYSGTNVDIFMDTENDGNADVLTIPGSSGNQTRITGINRLPSSNNGGKLFHVKKQSLSILP